MEAPEKIYLDPALDALTKALSEKTEDDIEYIRKDAFIEKASTWISEHTSLSEKLVTEDFRNYMKGE